MIYPEEVEAAINQHPAVWMSRVRSRRSPITDSLVEADVVLTEPTGDSVAHDLKREIVRMCEQVVRRSALRRFPAVNDVADVVEFLLGSKARSITGTVLTVDAGSTA